MGNKANVERLRKWLTDWHAHRTAEAGQKKKAAPSQVKGDDGKGFRGALLSGQPGIGKTTAVHAVCAELGWEAIEFNASDTRSKKSLKEKVAELTGSHTLASYFAPVTGPNEHGALQTQQVTTKIT